MRHRSDSDRIPGYCGLCIARCGSVATVCESAWGPDADRRASHLIYLTRVWSAARAYQQADGAIKPGWPVDVAAVLGRNFNSILQNQRGALALFAGKVGRFDLGRKLVARYWRSSPPCRPILS